MVLYSRRSGEHWCVDWAGQDEPDKEREHTIARFRLFRYRRPSLSTALGIKRAKRRFKTQTGYYAATRWMRAPTHFRRRALRRMGYYSGPMKLPRALFGRR